MASKVVDLTSENLYVAVFHEGAEPGLKFKIYHRSKIAGDPEKCLRKYAHVYIICDVCRCHGVVAEISDTLSYLERNLNVIREGFLVDYYPGSPGSGTLSENQYRPYFVVKEYIKIADKGTQTEEDEERLELQGKYEALAVRYDYLRDTAEAIFQGFQDATELIGGRMPIRRRDISPSWSDLEDLPRSRSPRIREVSPNSTPRRNVQNRNFRQSEDRRIYPIRNYLRDIRKYELED